MLFRLQLFGEFVNRLWRCYRFSSFCCWYKWSWIESTSKYIHLFWFYLLWCFNGRDWLVFYFVLWHVSLFEVCRNPPVTQVFVFVLVVLELSQLRSEVILGHIILLLLVEWIIWLVVGCLVIFHGVIRLITIHHRIFHFILMLLLTIKLIWILLLILIEPTLIWVWHRMIIHLLIIIVVLLNLLVLHWRWNRLWGWLHCCIFGLWHEGIGLCVHLVGCRSLRCLTN